MRKILAVLLAMALAMGCFSAWAEEETLPELYRSDFTLDGMDGWFANNATGEVTEEGAFAISGRSADWNAPKRVFDLKAGVEYKVTVEVYQDAVEAATFKITVEQDGGNWINLTSAEAPKGEWTTLEATFTLEQFNEYALYVETENNASLDYQIRNFTIYGPAEA